MSIFRRSTADSKADEGFTMTELLVAIGLLSILMALVTSAIVMMFQIVRKQQGQADAIDQIRVVVDKLDKSVRYANAVNTPGTGLTPGTTYVEWRIGNLTGATNYAQTCTQWRYVSSTGTLESRTWTEGSSGSTLTSWFTQATRVSQVGATNVFSFPPVVANLATGAAPRRQQLSINFNVTAGVQQKTVRATELTLTAQNTTSASVAAGICTDVSRP